MAKKQLKFDIRADNKSDRAFAQVRKNADKTAAHVKGKFKGGLVGGLTAGAGGLVGGLVAMVGVTKAVKAATAALDEFDLLAKKARTRGLSTDFYQGLQVGATEAGVSISMLESSLLAFVKRVGEAQGGLGPLVSGLKKTDAVLLENIRNAGSQEQALKLLSDAIARSDSATRKAALANAAFGRSGIEMVRVLNAGAAGLDNTLVKARKLGLVIDKELLASAEKTNNEFGLATRILGVNFKQVIVRLSPLILEVTKGLAEMARQARLLFDGVAGGGATVLEQKIERSYRVIEKFKKRINEPDAFGQIFGSKKFDQNMLSKERARLTSMRKQLERLQLEQERRVGSGAAILPKKTTTPLLPRLSPGTKPQKETEAEKAARRQADRIRSVADALKFETAQLGRNEKEQRLYNELKAAGVTLNSESGRRIAGLLVQLNREEERVKSVKQARERLSQATEYFNDIAADGLSSLIVEGESAKDVLRGLVRSLAQAALQATLLGKGPLGNGKGGLLGGLLGGLFGGSKSGGGLLAGLFKGFFADGGTFSRGFGVVGEQGPEIVTAGARPVTITPVRNTGSQRFGGGGGVRLNIVNQTGATVSGEQVSTRKAPDGQEIIDIVLSKVEQSIASGGFDTANSARYGARPVLNGGV